MNTRRNKIALIKGWANLSPDITLGEYERINADYIALITALKYPQLLPEEYSGFESDPTSMLTDIKKIINHWASNELEHILASEYANCVMDHGNKVKSVEGISLEIDWFYDTILNYHKNLKQNIIKCEVIYHRENGLKILIENKIYNRDEAINYLRPFPNLG